MINLLPAKTKEAIKFARLNVTLVQYTIVALFTVLTILSLLMFGKASLSTTEKDLNNLIEADKVKILELKQIDTQAQKLSNNITVINNLLDKEVKFSYLLQEIGAIMPVGATLSGVTLSQKQNDPISLTVFLDTAEKAGVLQENFIESRLFISADILDVTKTDNDSPGREYTANVQAFYDPLVPLSTIGDPVVVDEGVE